MKTGLICFGIIVLLIMGCVTHSYLPYNNTSQWNSFYTGGDGSTTAQAVIINSPDEKKTVDAENNYIKSIMEDKNKTYQITNRSTYGINGRVYDKVEVLVDNSPVEFHFDISESISKGQQP